MNIAKCYDCGIEYGGIGWIEASIPDKIWREISPHPTDPDCGLLCINCISIRCEQRGFKNVPVWLSGTEPLVAMSGDPGDSLEILRNWSY